MEEILLALAALALLICLLYKTLTKNHDFWKLQNVPFIPPHPLVGSMERESMGKPLQESEMKWYKKYGRIYGRYEGPNPVLTVGDPDVLKRIYVKDFHVFQNRRDMKFHDAIMDNTLFVLEGEDWKRVRRHVTPTFTTLKLKRMFPLLNECTDLLMNKLTESVDKGQDINCQENFSRFVLCSIGICGFGMTINDLKNPNNEFVEKSNKLFDEFMSWRTILTVLCPVLMKLFRIKLLNPETTNFYRNIVIQVLEERKRQHMVKDDFLQMLLDAENALEDSNNNGDDAVCDGGNCKGNGNSNTKPVSKGLSHDEILSQCITFFIAGVDPTISLLSQAVYQMAVNSEYQERVLEEVKSAVEKHDGIVSYEALQEMKFLDAVLNECERMCPAMVRSERRAEQDYHIKDKNIVLKKGMLVSIPVYAIHHDPEWYPEPHIFRPERFLDPHPSRPQYVHLPFGAGPRICVGLRFVQMQVKLCLAKIVLKFQIEPTSSTPKCLGYTECRNILKVDNIDVRLRERSSS